MAIHGPFHSGVRLIPFILFLFCCNVYSDFFTVALTRHLIFIDFISNNEGTKEAAADRSDWILYSIINGLPVVVKAA